MDIVILLLRNDNDGERYRNSLHGDNFVVFSEETICVHYFTCSIVDIFNNV